jgi:hypothetical protein
MLIIVRDYFSINKARYKRAFYVIYAASMTGAFVMMLQEHSNYNIQFIISWLSISAVLFALAVGSLVILLGSLHAYIKGIGLARRAGMSIS